jgi:hypothetical protein
VEMGVGGAANHISQLLRKTDLVTEARKKLHSTRRNMETTTAGKTINSSFCLGETLHRHGCSRHLEIYNPTYILSR